MFDMKRQMRLAKLKVGLVITLSLLILILAVFFSGKIDKIISPKIELKTYFRDVRGLRKGAPVWVFGTEVGSVKEIHLDPALGAIVKISINKDIQGFIKKDAQASILTMGLLGDKYIELSPGSPMAEPIGRGEMIKGVIPTEFSDMMETASISIGKLGEFVKKLDSLLERVESGKGTFARFLNDPTIYYNLNKTIKVLSQSVEDIKNQRGTLKMLIEDPSLYQRLVSAISSFETLNRRIGEGSGSFKKFLEDPSLYDKALTALSSIEAFSRKLTEGEGTLKRLIEDPKFYENLNQGLTQLSSLLNSINREEGLAGTLIRDQELVRELREGILELKDLVQDIKGNPKRYFKISLF